MGRAQAEGDGDQGGAEALAEHPGSGLQAAGGARARGAADSMARLFGVWKNPKPRPATNMPARMGALDTCVGSSASHSMPTTMVAAPMPLMVAGE